MTDRAAIRLAAARCRAESDLPEDEPVASARLLKQVREHRGLRIKRFRPNAVRGPEVLGTLNAFGGMIHVAARLSDPEAAFVEAHEIAHHVLHPDLERALMQQSTEDRKTPHGTWAAVGYSDRERLEVEADAFAAELLCPARWLRTQMEHHGRRPSDIATMLSIPIARVIEQAVVALLADGRGEPDPVASEPVPQADIDPRLRRVVVEASPGAGATTMAVSRAVRLTQAGVPPGRILLLAPTEGMVAALRSRAASSGCAKVGRIWTGTPTNLGFEIVAKNTAAFGRTTRFRLLDETGARTLFDEARAQMAPDLPGSESFRLAFDAKRRMIDPIAWREAAEADLGVARTELEDARARRAVALALVWATYEEKLSATDAIDEADLSAMPVRLLRTEPDVLAELRERFPHIVIDGLHDLSAAALEIIRLLAPGEGTTVWAAGDPRRRLDGHAQDRFEDFNDLATAIGASQVRLVGDRLRDGGIAHTVAGILARPTLLVPGPRDRGLLKRANLAEEARDIADAVERNRHDGIPIGEQVVLAHSHSVLRRISRALAATGLMIDAVPDLGTERVVGDLLAVAAFAMERDGLSFVQVGALPEYGIHVRDVLPARRWLKAPDRRMPRTISSASRIGLARLHEDFRGLDEGASAADALKTWLFERSDYLGRIFRDPDAFARHRNLASIHHLLRIAEEHEAQGDRSNARLRDRATWAGGLRQSTAYKWANPPGGREALRMMTINAARGHHFKAVHLAGVTKAGIGLKARANLLRPPSAFTRSLGGIDDLAGAELALLRVAVSRATTFLHVPGTAFQIGPAP